MVKKICQQNVRYVVVSLYKHLLIIRTLTNDRLNPDSIYNRIFFSPLTMKFFRQTWKLFYIRLFVIKWNQQVYKLELADDIIIWLKIINRSNGSRKERKIEILNEEEEKNATNLNATRLISEKNRHCRLIWNWKRTTEERRRDREELEIQIFIILYGYILDDDLSSLSIGIHEIHCLFCRRE